MDMLVLLAFIIYFIVVLGVGFYFYNKPTTCPIMFSAEGI